MSQSPPSINPFPGLRPFTQEEDHLFFGREEQTLELLQRLGSQRFVAVVGTSGSGKSSLVRCGLLSELLGGRMIGAGAAWEIAVTHPGGNPLALLTDALLDADLYDRGQENVRENLLATLSRSHFGLVEAVKQAGLGQGVNFLLVVDQFEEIFRFHEAGQTQQEMANEFVSLLLEAAGQMLVPIYIVLTMRSDFIGECGQFEGLAERVNRGEFLIPRLTREQYKRVIEGPIKVAGGQIAPRLLQRLLNDLGQQADQLPCLQHALMRTWNLCAEKDNGSALDLDDYQRVGKMSQALSLHADEVYGALASDRQRQLCKGLFQALTVQESETRGIRRPQRFGRLCKILEVSADELLPVIDAYRQHGVTFLMPSPDVALTDRTIVDISHESLMRVWDRLRQWVAEEAQAAGIYLRLSESAALNAQAKAGLYRDPELGIALAWQELKRPNAAWAERYRPGFDAAIAFLNASQEASVAEAQARDAAHQHELDQARELAESQQLRLEQQQRSSRNLRRMIGGLAVVAVIAGVACIAALLAHQKARQNEDIARSSANSANQSAKQAKQSQQDADLARAASEKSREAAQAEAYRAVFSEARALRAGREPGWRAEALSDLERLAASPYPKRDMLEIRTEAVAALGTPDVQLIGQTQPSPNSCGFAILPDGQTLVTVDGLGGLDFWNVRDLKHVASADAISRTRPQTMWNRNNVVGLPGDQGFAVTTRDLGIVFTDPTGKQLPRPPITPPSGTAAFLTSDGTGRRIVISWRLGPTVVHDLDTGKVLAQVSSYAAALSPDGKWLAYEGPQFAVRLRSLDSDQTEKTLGQHSGKIARFAFSADGRTLASGSEDHTAMLWDVSGQKQPVVLRGHRDTVNDVAVSPDGGWVATVSTDCTARIWDVATGQSLATLPCPTFLVDARWTPDGEVLAVNSGYQVSLYRVTGRRVFQRLAMHRHGIQSVTAHPRLDQLVTGADDHRVIGWSVATTQPSARWNELDSQYVTAVAYSSDGSLLATGTGYGGLSVRDAQTGAIKVRMPMAKDGIEALVFDPTGQLLASGDRKGRVIVRDLATARPAHTFQVGSSYVWSLAFLDDGRKLLALGWNGPLVLFDLESGKVDQQVHLSGGGRGFVVDPARKRLIVSGNTGDLSSVSIPELTETFRLPRAGATIESLALSPDGSLLATGGSDRRVTIRDAISFAPLLVFPEWTGNIRGLAFTLGGRRLAYVGTDSDVALWDLARLHDDLKAVGLAWDQSAPAVNSEADVASDGPRVLPQTPTIPRGSAIDVKALLEAERLLHVGITAYEAGRPLEAIRHLEQARDQFRSLQRASPANAAVVSLLSNTLASLGDAFEAGGRPEEALATYQEARAVLEGMRRPSAADHYNLACVYCHLITASVPASAPVAAVDRDALAEKALAALQRAFTAGFAQFDLIERDAALAPLRESPGFQILVLHAAGRHSDAVPWYAKVSAATPTDTLLPIRVAALQAWFEQEKDLTATCQRVLELANDTQDPTTAERLAKACSLRQSDAKIHQAALVLARRAVELGKGHGYMRFYQMALGMAAYRSGLYQEADAVLLEVSRHAPANNQALAVTTGFYRAMSLFRQGKTDEARKLAIAAAARMKPLPADEKNPLAGNASHDDVIVWLAYREAKALIQFEPVAPPASRNSKE